MIEIIKKILKDYDIDGRTAGAAAKLIDIEAKAYYGRDGSWRTNIPRKDSDYIFKTKTKKENIMKIRNGVVVNNGNDGKLQSDKKD